MIGFFKNIPLAQNIWARIREQRIINAHAKVARYWTPLIQDYIEGNIPKYNFIPKKEINGQKIIWQYWGQGAGDPSLPQIVRLCFESVDRYKGDYVVIRLDDESVSSYVDLPDYVLTKLKERKFTRTFFSDLLRVVLLNTYGGVWLDATILLTGPLDKYIEYDNFFLYQRDPQVVERKTWEQSYAYYWSWHKDFKVRMLSSAMFARRGSTVIQGLQDLMLYYWQTEESLLDYFTFQILFHEMVSVGAFTNCKLVSDVKPHVLQYLVSNNLPIEEYMEELKSNTIHKMSYFEEERIGRLLSVLEKLK